MTASVTLKQVEKYNGLMMKCRMLMGHMQKVDVTILIEQVIAGNKKEVGRKVPRSPSTSLTWVPLSRWRVMLDFRRSSHGVTRKRTQTERIASRMVYGS